jgi:DNA topoisomerase IB
MKSPRKRKRVVAVGEEMLHQAKVYLQPGQKAPKGVVVHKGKKGGSWYETSSRGEVGGEPSPKQKKNVQRMKGRALPGAWKTQEGPLNSKDLLWLKSFGVSKYPPPGNTKPGTIQVHRNADPATQALMTWRDLNGKYQHSYSKEFHQNNAALKWKSVEKYRPQVARMREVLNKVVKKSRPGSPEHQEAMVASIIAHTGLRPGNQLSAATGHFGVSTLQTQHLNFGVGIEDVHIEFVGKSGMLNKKDITDPTLVSGLKELVKQARADKRKNLFTVDVSNVRSILPKGMKLKTFRTILATEEAERFLDGKYVKLSGNKAKDKKVVARVLKEASSHVASQLNNTPAVARSSYIHPNVFDSWLKKVGGENVGA